MRVGVHVAVLGMSCPGFGGVFGSVSLHCMMDVACYVEATVCFVFATGQIVFRRHAELPAPSRQSIRATCAQLLPLVEMYCRYELEEDCGDLQALMLRFDCETELESHALGRSLLFLVRDVQSDAGLRRVPSPTIFSAPPNPFDAVRARLATIDAAIRGLHTQVPSIVGFYPACTLLLINKMALHDPAALCTPV